jgi:AcrR family transcriptional regulator
MPAARTPSSTPKRADAERNREKILAAARAGFAEVDGDPSMAEISRRAEVGMATLYRNFASRRELLEALYINEIDAICAAAQELSDSAAPGEALVAWLRRFFDYFRSKRPIAGELLESSGEENPVFGAGRPRVIAAGEPLLAAAQAVGAARAGLNLPQVLDMVGAIAKISGDRSYVEPILQATLDGLRP